MGFSRTELRAGSWALAACCAVASPAAAAGDKVGTISVTLVGGPAVVASESLRDDFNVGYSLEARGSYCFTEHVSFAPLRFSYASFGPESQARHRDTNSVLAFAPAVILSLDNEQNVNPFLIAGAGLYRHDPGREADTSLGFEVGGGVEFAIGSAGAATVEAHWVRANGDRFDYAPVVNFGLTYYFGAE